MANDLQTRSVTRINPKSSDKKWFQSLRLAIVPTFDEIMAQGDLDFRNAEFYHRIAARIMPSSMATALSTAARLVLVL